MQELHEDRKVGRKGSSAPAVSRRTATLVVVLFAVVVLGALTLLTTKTGQKISGLQLNSLASLASTSKSDKTMSTDLASNPPVVNCVVAPCPGDPNSPIDGKVTSPVGGETWYTGQKQVITWKFVQQASARVGVQRVTITMEKPRPACLDLPNPCDIAQLAPYTITTTELNDGEFVWPVPTNIEDQFLGEETIVVTMNDTNIKARSGVFKLARSTGTNTAFTITSPRANEKWAAGQTYTIRWVNSGFVQLKATIGLSTYNINTDNLTRHIIIADRLNNTGSYQWTVPSNLADEFYTTPVSIDIGLTGGQYAQSQQFWLTRPAVPTDRMSILNDRMAPGFAAVAYVYDFNVHGGTGPYHWSVSAPAAAGPVSINSLTGEFTSASPRLGHWKITVQVADSTGQQASRLYDWTVIAAVVRAHPEGSLVQGLFNIPSSVCLIQNGKLFTFPTGDVFMSHGYHWEDIVPANAGDAALPLGDGMVYAPGTLVYNDMSAAPQTTYFLVYPNRVLRPFDSLGVFQDMGYRADMARPLSQGGGPVWTSGKPMTLSDSHPPGTDILNVFTVYRISADNKRLTYPSIAVYASWHTFGADFSRVVPANRYDRQLPLGGEMPLRVVPH